MAQRVNARVTAYLAANLSNPKGLKPDLKRWLAGQTKGATNRFLELIKNAAGS